MVRSASQLSLFQSTHPARGATFILPVFAGWHNISIHAPREGCDGTPPGSSSGRSDFNPRTPRGVRLIDGLELLAQGSISIHAPREGCDPPQAEGRCPRCRYFNPRTPRGVRLSGISSSWIPCQISIHAPREGCDVCTADIPPSNRISIHAPREGCDSKLYQRAESLLGSICLFAQGEEG